MSQRTEEKHLSGDIMIRRRSFLAASAAAMAPAVSGTRLAAPALAAPAQTVSFVPQANLNSIDPVWTTATTTRNFGLMVFETLFGRDEG
jgi:peptide/nickel transport system substrate-binding protein